MPIALPVPVRSTDWKEGPDDAPVTLVAYCDFECGDCRDAYPVLKQLRKELAGRVQFVFRHLPLTDIHPYALEAAKAAEAAGALGRFWEMHDALFEGPRAMTPEVIGQDAEKAGLAPEAVLSGMAEERAYSGVREDVDGIRPSGKHSTPALFLNNAKSEGMLTLEDLHAALGM